MFGIQTHVSVAMFSGYDPDGFPLAQYDAEGEEPKVEPVELHHPFGFVARPRDPDVDKQGHPLEGKACNLFVGFEGDTLHAWLGYDPRFILNIPQLKKGGSAQYCAAGSFRVFDGDDGTETLYVPVPGNQAHVVTTGVDGNGKPYIGIEHAHGMAITMLEKSLVAKNAAGNAYLEINDDGYVLNGNGKVIGGMLVGNVASAQPVAKAPALMTLLTTLAGFIDAKQGASSTASAAVAAATVGITAAMLSVT